MTDISEFKKKIIESIVNQKNLPTKDCKAISEKINKNKEIKTRIEILAATGNIYEQSFLSQIFDEKLLKKGVVSAVSVKPTLWLELFNSLNLLSKNEILFYYKYKLYDHLFWAVQHIRHTNKELFDHLIKHFKNTRNGLKYSQKVFEMNPELIYKIKSFKDTFYIERSKTRSKTQAAEITALFNKIIDSEKKNLISQKKMEIKSISKLKNSLNDPNLSNKEKDIIDRYLHQKTTDGKQRSKSSRFIQRPWSIKDRPVYYTKGKKH